MGAQGALSHGLFGGQKSPCFFGDLKPFTSKQPHDAQRLRVRLSLHQDVDHDHVDPLIPAPQQRLQRLNVPWTLSPALNSRTARRKWSVLAEEAQVPRESRLRQAPATLCVAMILLTAAASAHARMSASAHGGATESVRKGLVSFGFAPRHTIDSRAPRRRCVRARCVW